MALRRLLSIALLRSVMADRTADDRTGNPVVLARRSGPDCAADKVAFGRCGLRANKGGEIAINVKTVLRLSSSERTSGVHDQA